MWWKPPTLPVTAKDQAWVDESFAWFATQCGVEYARAVTMLLPGDFPDSYQGDASSARALLDRICPSMQVDPTSVDLEIYDDHTEEMRRILPTLAAPTLNSPAGLYLPPRSADERHIIGIEQRQLQDPFVLVATLAHEVGHVRLLGGGLIERDPYHELLTDLFTVFCGFGVFSANSACMFDQHQGNFYHGWSYRRHGYLSQQVYGYALACWTFLPQEWKPAWARYLTLNVKCDFEASLKYLQR